jgi:hypothetical protein
MFYRPTQGHMNSTTQVPGLYRKDDVTPYMHVFAKHVPQFMRQLKEIGLSLRTFSTSSIEKKNHNHVLKIIIIFFLFEKIYIYY